MSVDRLTVISDDGTPIVCEVAGSGPPLLLVHGSAGAASRWVNVLPALGEQFTVYAMDRRGRGASGDHADYAMQREIDDVVAMANFLATTTHGSRAGAGTDAPAVNLLGHSYGAICAIEAAPRITGLRRLIAYEPPVPAPADQVFAPGFIERLEAMIAAGDRDGAVSTFLREEVKMPAADLERVRALPSWSSRMAAAHTLPREFRALTGYRIDAARLHGLTAPTLLLLGGDSPQRFITGIDMVTRALPHSQVVRLAGQQHNAMDTAPALFVSTVLTFLANG